MPEDSQYRSLLGRAAAHKRWAMEADPSAATAPARKAFLVDRFEREVDPDGTLPAEERARRAGQARKAYFLQLAARSAKARRKGKATIEAAELHRLVDEVTGGVA